jgi:gas vesicle protein
MSRDSNWGGNLVFFLLGAATGAAIALLYAPQEGEATRRIIAEKAGDVKDKATDYTSTVASTAKDKWGQLTDKAQEIVARGQGAANDAIDNAAESAHKSVNSVS